MDLEKEHVKINAKRYYELLRLENISQSLEINEDDLLDEVYSNIIQKITT